MMFAAMPGSCIASMWLHRILIENTMERTLKHGTFGEESSKSITGEPKAWDLNSCKRQRLLNLKIKSPSVKGKGMIKAAVRGGQQLDFLKNLGWQAGKGALSKVSTMVSDQRQKNRFIEQHERKAERISQQLRWRRNELCSNDGREGQVWMRGKGFDKLQISFC